MKVERKSGLRLFLAVVALTAGCAPKPPQIACTMEAKACPDGSYVGRNPQKNCEFKPCPAG
ncbi:MAG TPA: hypothetical protein VNP36_12730 [Burkholderiales bacterium]|nr:hypothetical protein [Burkholderiales bacterium]